MRGQAEDSLWHCSRCARHWQRCCTADRHLAPSRCRPPSAAGTPRETWSTTRALCHSADQGARVSALLQNDESLQKAACLADCHHLQSRMTSSDEQRRLIPPVRDAYAKHTAMHMPPCIAAQSQSLQKRLQVSALATLGRHLGEGGSVCCVRPVVTWVWTTGPQRGSVSGEGIMTCVGPHVRPLSLLTAQYTLCPCAPSNHLPTPCRVSYDELQTKAQQQRNYEASRRRPHLGALTRGDVACKCHLCYRVHSCAVL